MPFYDYRCNKCGKEFEEFQSIKADPITICEDKDCAGEVERLIAKGAGFKINGYSYDNSVKGGKYAWRQNMSMEQQSQVIAGEIEPY